MGKQEEVIHQGKRFIKAGSTLGAVHIVVKKKKRKRIIKE